MSDIIGVDHSAPILEAVKQRLMEQGVLYQGMENGDHSFKGMGNGRTASLHIPKLDEAPNDQTKQALIAEYLDDVTSQIRMGGALR